LKTNIFMKDSIELQGINQQGKIKLNNCSKDICDKEFLD
jgi:hypothetical protein